ncbi:hypothetical protein [uncultured Neptuniibacter sp.]|uniref:hypothetical protein n=1 Tax=uncultured Neptuniibacter sp. TaxID=502143 RepID=UPI0026142642|nr:hypothetical protein [uncultured Neptuniibacter sp.]
MRALTAICVSLFLMTGCKSTPMLPLDATICDSPRPQICTMDYRPACGYKEKAAPETYSNLCSACADPVVVGATEGTCQ